MRCQSPPLTAFSSNSLEAQEPFGQVLRGSGECTRPESVKSNRVVLRLIVCRCQKFFCVWSQPFVARCCSTCARFVDWRKRPFFFAARSQDPRQSLITGDRQTTTRFIAYPFLSCEQSFGTSQCEQDACRAECDIQGPGFRFFFSLFSFS